MVRKQKKRKKLRSHSSLQGHGSNDPKTFSRSYLLEFSPSPSSAKLGTKTSTHDDEGGQLRSKL
jgi:hypothetical protein